MVAKILCSLLLFAIGIAAVYFFARTNILECTRDRHNIISAEIVRKGINYRKKEHIAPGELLRAELDALYGKKGSITYRIRLVLSSHTTFLTRVYATSYRSAANKVDRINYFIQESSLRSVSIVQDDRWGVYFMGIILWIAGIIVLMIQIP